MSRDPAELAQTKLVHLLQEVTGYYDQRGQDPPKSAHSEKNRILQVTHVLINIHQLLYHHSAQLAERLTVVTGSNDEMMKRIVIIVAAAILNPGKC